MPTLLLDDFLQPAMMIDVEYRVIAFNQLANSLFGEKMLPGGQITLIDLLEKEDGHHVQSTCRSTTANSPGELVVSLIDTDQKTHRCKLALSALSCNRFLLLFSPLPDHPDTQDSSGIDINILEAQYQHNPCGILLVNRYMEMISFNREFVRIWNIPEEIQRSRDEEKSLQSVLCQLIDPQGFINRVRELYERRDEVSTEEIMLRDDRVLYRHTYPIFRDSIYLGRVWYFLDITPLKTAMRKIERQQVYLNSILEHIRDGVVACDSEGQITLMNRSCRKLLGLPCELEAKHVLGTTRMGGATSMLLNEQLTALLPLSQVLSGSSLKNEPLEIISEHGAIRLLRANGQPITDGTGNKLGAVISLHDITDLEQAREQLRHMAYHDVLTKLPNRRLFHDIMGQCLNHAHRHKRKIGILFLDLDNFKAVNDHYGHDFGDRLLVEVAEVLRNFLRESDILCRWGGDEFVVGLLESGSDEDMLKVAHKLCKKIVGKLITISPFAPVTVSIGIAIYPRHGTQPDLLIRNADMAMYRAKRSGKNRCELFAFSHPNRTPGLGDQDQLKN